jgi:hypothetical protein
MSKSILTFLRGAIGALVLCAFTSTSFAAVDMFLEIKDIKGKVVSRCEVSKDGSFSCPALPAGEYTAMLSWSWGVSNQGASSSSSMGAGKISTPMAGGDRGFHMIPEKISFTYDVKSPRDVATGQASGKRTHKPIKIIKEWDATSPQLSKQLEKSSPKMELCTFTVDEDCDGITGTIAGHGTGGKMEIESWSWGVSNGGSSR